jgi:hypothetical protein
MVIQEFVSASYSVGSLLTFLKQHGFLYFPVTRGASGIAREEHSNLLFRFYTTLAKITSKSEGLVRM